MASVPLDAAVDNFAATRFIHERLPPALAPPDRARRPPPSEAESLSLRSRVRLVTRHVARLAVEGDAAVRLPETTQSPHTLTPPPPTQLSA